MLDLDMQNSGLKPGMFILQVQRTDDTASVAVQALAKLGSNEHTRDGSRGDIIPVGTDVSSQLEVATRATAADATCYPNG